MADIRSKSACLALGLAALLPLVARGAMLAGHEARSGRTLEIEFAVPPYYQKYAAQGGNPTPTIGRAVFGFPDNFAPNRPWPILIITSTTDGHRTSPDDVPFYLHPAAREGRVILATDATIRPHLDSETWRLSMLAATLDLLHHQWPQSASWPVAFAGLSGGAKRTGFMAAMLATTKSMRISGMFLAGINDDRISVASRRYHPLASFLEVPIWISSGLGDSIAPTRG